MKKWTKAEIDFLKENYPKFGHEYCLTKLDRTKEAITQMLYKNHITLDLEISKRIHSNNGKRNTKNCKFHIQKFLNIDSPEAAYILGYIWADGYLYKNKIIIECITDDLLSVEQIFDSLGNWTKTSRQRNNWKSISKFEFTSKIIFEYLVSLDYQDKSYKSPGKILELIPDRLQSYWFMGYLDGDGCIHVNKNPKKYTDNITFSSGYDQDWLFLETLCNKLSVKFTINRFIKNNNQKYSAFIIYNKQAIPLLNYLYQDKILIGLPRKYSKYKEYMKRHS